MAKRAWKPGNLLYPLPAVLVSCGNDRLGINLITIAWTGTLCSDPPLCYISVRPERHSYGLIAGSGEYVINLTTRALAHATDWCGVKSGRELDKWKEMGLTPVQAQVVGAPLVAESPLNIECRVMEIRPLGSHHMFLSEVVAVNADEALIDPRSGALRLAPVQPLCYLHGGYFQLGRLIGRFGYSVRRRAAGRRKRR
jgi:flavin reductase (DIM6/NTAB) family NADH-FMN oxidoreductase RutF